MRIRLGLLFCFRVDGLLLRNIGIPRGRFDRITYNQKLPTRPRLFVDFFPDNDETEFYYYMYIHFVHTDKNKTDK